MFLRQWIEFTAITLLISTGCQRASEPDRTTKLERVRSAALLHVAAEDRDAFKNATPVLNLEDLPTPGVGLRIPITGSSNAIFVLFEMDYFDSNGIEKLATEAVEDYVRSKPAKE